jgi:3-oxoacyl-[acyl-carrier-protein] synthase II
MAGRSAIRLMEVAEYQRWAPVAAAVPAFDMQQYLSRKQMTDTDRFTQLALIATAEAMADAGFQPNEANPFGRVDGERVGIALGSAIGGVQSLESGALQLADSASGRTSPRLVSKSIPNAAAGAMAIRWGIQGPVLTYATACASSANAIGEAGYWLRAGEVDVVLAGGAECLFTPSILAGLSAAGALAKTGPADASQWSRPFDRNRQGMVMGEGAAVLVLENWEKAVRRGAHIYAELVGYGTSNDAHHETAPHPDGRGAGLAMQRALKSAQLAPADVGYINAHATSTPAGDAAEGKALRTVFGDALTNIPVSSIKGAVGHMLGVAGATESIASILAIVHGHLPPTLHCNDPDEFAPPDIIPNQARRQHVNTVLSNSFGFGGQNATLVWARPERG